MDAQILQAYQSAADLSIHFITVASGILALSVSFAKDIFKNPTRKQAWLLALAWALYLASILFGFWSLMALTGSLEATRPLTSIGTNARFPVTLQIISFGLATSFFMTCGLLSLLTLSRRDEPAPPSAPSSPGGFDAEETKALAHKPEATRATKSEEPPKGAANETLRLTLQNRGRSMDQQGGNDVSLESLEKYISGLWKIGGLPLVVLGLGAVALFVPTFSGYSEVQRAILAGGLFFLGSLTWVVATLIAFKRWRTETEIAATRDSRVLEAVAKLCDGTTSDVVSQKAQVLLSTLATLQTPGSAPFFSQTPTPPKVL